MEPIVSPLFIFMLHVIGSIQTTLILGSIALGIVGFVGLVGYWIESDFAYGEKEKEKARGWYRLSRKIILPFSIVLVLAIFIPSRNTIIAMYVTKFVTTQNIEKAIEAGGNLKETIKKDIIEIIDAIQNKQDKEE